MQIERTQREAAERCRYCPRLCNHACPVLLESSRETLAPWAKMSLVALGARERPLSARLPRPVEQLARRAGALLGLEPEAPLDADTAELFYGCTGCLKCRDACDHENNVPEALYAARAAAVDAGVAPAGAQALADRFARLGHGQRGDLAGALALLTASESTLPEAPVLLAGCEAPLDTAHMIRSALRVARKWGAPLSLASQPLCCGRPLWESGHRDAFRRHVTRAWEQLGDSPVVVLSAACAQVLTASAQAVGVTPRAPVTHLVNHLADHAPARTHGQQLPGRVVYHDPCGLGRAQGEYNAPRRLLALAMQGGVVEPEASREDSDCCGAGGLLPEVFPDTARAMAMRRADALRATGAERVATACPSCRHSLAAAGLPVVDLVELLAEWLAVDEEGGEGSPAQDSPMRLPQR